MGRAPSFTSELPCWTGLSRGWATLLCSAAFQAHIEQGQQCTFPLFTMSFAHLKAAIRTASVLCSPVPPAFHYTREKVQQGISQQTSTLLDSKTGEGPGE